MFNYTSKHFLLIIGTIFSVLLRPDKVLERPVAVWSVMSDDYHSLKHQGRYVLLTAHVIPLHLDSTR